MIDCFRFHKEYLHKNEVKIHDMIYRIYYKNEVAKDERNDCSNLG